MRQFIYALHTLCNACYFYITLDASKVSETPRTVTPDMEADIAYIGAPPISSKMPPLDSRRVELERVNKRLLHQMSCKFYISNLDSGIRYLPHWFSYIRI